MLQPIALRFSVTVAIRLVSFTFSSAASLMTVVPSAWAAITARMGISSIKAGMMSPSIVAPFRSLERTKMSARPSPPRKVSFTRVISAPIALHTSRNPALVKLVPTFLTSSSEPGTRRPAAIKYAADEMSPGTKICCPYNSSHA